MSDALATFLPVRPLSAAGFAAYGEVLDLASPDGARVINAGTSRRQDLPLPDLQREGGRPLMAVFHARPQPPQGPWHAMERHRLGSQSFVPLAPARWLVLVALGAHAPDPATLAAFSVRPGQGITLRAGTWHHPLVALEEASFLVVERQGGALDCEVVQLPSPVFLAWP